jgi:hypothetical protein
VRTITTRQKLLLAATSASLAAAAIGVGSFANWSTSAVAPEAINTGAFALHLDGTLVDRAEVPVVNFAPGDSVTRQIDVTNAGGIDFASVVMHVIGSDSPLLDSTGKGLQIQVRDCRNEWQRSSNPLSLGWDCIDQWSWPEGQSIGSPVGYGATVLEGNFDGTPQTLPYGQLRAGQEGNTSTHLLVRISLPASDGADQDVNDAGSDYATYGNQSATLSFAFTATQRTGRAVGNDYYPSYGPSPTASPVDDANGNRFN